MTLLTQLRENYHTNETATSDTLYNWMYKISRLGNHTEETIVSKDLMATLLDLEWSTPLSKYDKLRKFSELLGIDDYSFSYCHDCSSLEHDTELLTCYEDYGVCQTCIDDDYTYSEYRDTYVRYEDADDEEELYDEDSQDEYVLSYDYDVMQDLKMTSTKDDKLQADTPYYGIELEVERRNNADEYTTKNIYNSFTDENGMQFALLKSDGSLSNGFEIVTAPATINAHKKHWDKFFKSDGIKEVKSWNTDTTGMHIHISRTALTQLHIGKILVFINDEKNSEFVNHIAGRSSDQWAKKSSKKIIDCVQSSDKYEAINTSHRHTIELRIFKGNLARLGFYRVLEFVDALVSWSKVTSMTKLSYTDFLNYIETPNIRSQYPIFYGWLSRKSYCVGKPSRKIDWSDEQNNLKETA